MTRPSRALVLGIGVFALLGLLLRWRAALAFHQSPTAMPLGLDAAFYDRWARALAEGSGPPPQVFPLAPLYPTLLGLLYRVPGLGPDAMFTVQHAFGVGLVFATGLIAAVLAAGRRGMDSRPAPWVVVVAGLGAAGLVAVSASLIAYEHALLPEILGALLLTAGVGGLALAAERGRITGTRAFGCGLALGLDALVRPSGVVLVPVIAAWALVAAPQRRLSRALLILLGAALAIAPVTLRNRMVGGEWVLVTAGGGFNFYIGNHAGADGGYVQPRGAHFVPGDAGDPLGRGPAERARGRPLSAGEVSRYWGDEARHFWRAAPAAAGRLFLRKMALVWTRAEIPQILHVAELRRDVPAFGRLPLLGPAVLMPVALLGLAYALAGAAGRGLWRDHPGIHLVALALAAFTVATALFFVTDRFRIQAVPLLAISGALGGAALAHALRGWKTALPAVLLTGIAWFATWPGALGVSGTLGEPWLGPMNRALAIIQAGGDSSSVAAAFAEALAHGPRVARIYANRGEWLRLRGDFSAAEEDLEQAIALDPDDPAAFTALAAVEAGLGDPAALSHYDRARALDPSYAPAALGRGQLLLRSGRAQEAVSDLEAALQGPDSAAAHDALGVALALQGDRAQGWVHLERAVALAPHRPLYHLHRGLALAEAGQPAAAEAAFRAALAIDPTFHRARLGLAVLYRDRGDRARARAEVDTVLARAPDDPDARALALELAPGR